MESWKEESGVEWAWVTVERTAGGVTYEARTVCQAVSPEWSSTWRAQQNAKLGTSGDALVSAGVWSQSPWYKGWVYKSPLLGYFT